MAQVSPHYCPRCGAALTQPQQPCPRCGWRLSGPSTPARQTSLAQFVAHDHDLAGSTTSSTRIEEQETRPVLSVSPPTSTPQPAPSLPVPVQKKRAGRGILVAILLFLLLFIGTIAYIVVQTIEANTQPAITTITLNTTVTYAGVTMTVQNVQQAQRFIDDKVTSAAQVMRVDLKAANQTSVPVNVAYPSLFHLILPGGKLVAPTYVKGRIGLPAGATQSVVIDFPLTTALPASKLTLRLGAANEVQMDIPLGAHADLNQYAPRTETINQQLQYYGLNYTLVNEVSQLSIAGQQAPSGMRYVVITLSVDNTLSQTAIPGSPYDYVRLKVGATMLTPVDATLPVSFATGVTGQRGTVTFLVPQQATSVTFLLGSPQATGFSEAETTFSLP
jgi:hypothetical protein